MKKSELFPLLEPPPYGWTRMKSRLGVRRAKSGWLVAAGAVVATALVVVVLVLPGERVDLMPAAQMSVTAGVLGLDVGNGEPVALTGGQEAGLLRMPSSDPGVVFYRLALVDSEPPPAEP